MGISGLLPLLKAITRNVHISQYANQRVAVDAYCWLHRGAYSCSTELCQNIPTVKYINFCLSRVQLLRSFNITPVLVFDGGALPSKRGQEEKRRKKRREERAKAAEYLQQGNRAAANDCFRKAVDITPRMAHKLIKALQQHGVECIVAPYEADAQLAYLSQTGYVHSVISEDSDLLPFGCKRVLFKMDGDGNGKEVQLSDLGQNTPTRFHNFTHAMFRQMCILSGCDYLASITGLGMKKAHGLLSKYRTMDRVFRFLKNDRTFVVPSDYEDAFERAERTFLHQSVFDHVNKRVIPLNPYPDGTDASSFPFCGELIPDDIACLIASGCVDPYSYEPFEEEAVQAPRHHHSAPTPTIVVPPHHHESDSGPSVGASYDQSQDALRASRSMRALSSSTGSCPPDRKLGRMPSFGGGRSKLPLLLPQRNSISSYFTPSSRHTLRPFVPPRGSSQSSQSSLEESERETPVDDDVVIEVKSEEEEEEEEEAGEEAEEDEKEKEQQREQEPARREGSRERQNREEQEEGTVYRSERMLEEERGDGWEVVKQRSYEVLVARTPSPHSRFKVAPRALMGPEEEERSPSRRRLLFEDQVQVVVTSKYFSATTTTTTTATATTTSRCSIPATAPQSSTTAATPTPTVQATVSPTRTPTPRVASSAFAWLDGPLLLDPTAQSVEESDEEEEEARSREAKEAKEKPTGEALRRSLRVTPPDKERQHAPERPPSRKRRREGEEELEEENETRDVPVKRERKSALMSKVEAFLRSDSLEEAPRGNDGGKEEEKEGEGKRSEEPWKPTTEPTPAETIDLTFDELPDFESPMISRGKRLSTPLGFLSRSRNKQQQQQTQLPSTTPAKNGNGVGTLYSYFNKQGFNRQSPEASSSRSPSSQSPPSALPSLGEQPKLEEDGIEIVGFTPRTPAATDNTTAPRTRRTGFTSPYFS